jgi:hypothetical protein
VDHLGDGIPKRVDDRGLEDRCEEYATWRSQLHNATARLIGQVEESLV